MEFAWHTSSTRPASPVFFFLLSLVFDYGIILIARGMTPIVEGAGTTWGQEGEEINEER